MTHTLRDVGTLATSRTDSHAAAVRGHAGVRDVELIIPSYNRVETLTATLRAVRRLYPKLRIRVALQGPDQRQQLEEELSGDHNFVVDYTPAPGLIPAVNAAIAKSQAEICILLDDDAVPCDGWLEAHVAAFGDPTVAYTYGREVNARLWRSPLSELARHTMELFAKPFLANDRILYGRIVGWTNALGFVFGNFFLPGTCVINAPAEGNFAIRRSVFLDIGGFNEAFRGNCWGYGPELGIRLARKGLYGRYVGDAIMIHRPQMNGGTRAIRGREWYRDYIHNNRILIEAIGPWAWIGAAPRLLRRRNG